MNIAPLCVLIIITGGTDGFHVENARASNKDQTGERIYLRKLQTFKTDDPKEVKTVTWNQILADAFVNRVKILSFHKISEKDQATDVEQNNNLFTNCISEMMHLYKILIYDKINNNPHITKTIICEDPDLSKENKKVLNNNADKEINIETEKDFLSSMNPKDDVEIIEPRYHGKMCDGCDGETEKNYTSENEIVETTEIVQTTATGCPVGLVASEDGSCTNPKSKFILSIPYQCPIGYRRDWLGYCRPQL